jgi:hypothetical protein
MNSKQSFNSPTTNYQLQTINYKLQTMNLPQEIAVACASLFELLPLDQAMPHLVGSHPTNTAVVDRIVADPVIAKRPAIASALWLYVSDLSRSHTISQGIEDATGSYWHGIMHRREGDFSNSHYWMRRAAAHPLMAANPEIDSDKFIDEVAAANGADLPELVAKQRAEWKALFEYCASTP